MCSFVFTQQLRATADKSSNVVIRGRQFENRHTIYILDVSPQAAMEGGSL
jgi:hypothetical protein